MCKCINDDYMKKLISVFFTSFVCLFLFLASHVSAQNETQLPQLGNSTLGKVISAMTLEEKSLLVTGAKRRGVIPVPLAGRKQKNIEGVGGYTYPFPHLGIPSIMLSDGPAGLRISPKRAKDSNRYYCTAFPVATLLASSWDTQLVEKVGTAMGKEALEYGVDILLAPGLNIHRNPLGGRCFEYYSEDPLISGKMAAAIVNGIQSQGVGTSIKHFVANEQETSRRTINTIVSERALREIYLLPFEIAVKESNPWTVMTSYNKINGTYTSESRELLEVILRKEWGFKGFVMSDWYGGSNAVDQMKAGNDLLMPGLKVWSDKIDSAVNVNQLDVSTLDANIEHLLNIVLKTSTFKDYKYSNKPNLELNAQIARTAASQSMVLLKNVKKTLPFTKDIRKIAAFGNYSYKMIVGGTGSGMVNNQYSISLAQGLENTGFTLNENLKDKYKDYLKQGSPVNQKEDSLITAMPIPDKVLTEMPTNDSLIQQAAIDADVAVITLMRVFGEGGDRKLDSDFKLSNEETKIINSISDAFRSKGKKVIVVLNIGGVIETISWRDKVDAILLAWQPGQEGGNAIADILSGKVNPSGKLPTTFPQKYSDVPSALNFPGTPINAPEQVKYEEGVYVGYRYFDTYKINPAYEFGYGLSYTNFKYSNLKLNSDKITGKATVTVNIKNTGSVKGQEVVQLYISAPAKTMDKPNKELKSFAKTKVLVPGESQILSFSLDSRSLASFDTQKTAWIAEAGKYRIKIGASSKDIRQSASFILKNSLVVEKVNKVLIPQVQIDEFHGKLNVR